MSKISGNQTKYNVQYIPKNGNPVGIPCKYRYHEIRRKDVQDQTTISNRCKLAASGTNKNCTYPGNSDKNCPRLQ